MTEAEQALNALEDELTLFARHHLSTRQAQPGHILERSAYLLINRLELEESMSLRELAEAFGLDVSTINRQVAPLLKRGLVERFADPEGGMARRLRPTTAGVQALEADRERSRNGIARVVDGWPQEQVMHFLELLTQFNVSVEDLEGKPWPRKANRNPHLP